jgi:hypothetical protein
MPSTRQSLWPWSGMYQASNRHIGIKFRWLREMWASGVIEISYVDTKNMRADGMTKPLDRNLHMWIVAKHLGMGRIKDQVDERMEDDARV